MAEPTSELGASVPLRPVASGRLALLGPAFVAAVAYVDPGNVATNLAAGSRYGYLLVWVLVGATVMAGLVQYLSAKVGVVTGRSLPELLRDRLGRRSRLAFWAQAEVIALATDVAEIVGGAIALDLLFGLPLVAGGLATGAASLVLLLVQDRGGQATFERVVVALLALIAVGFAGGLVVAPPDGPRLVAGLVPHLAGTESVLLAAGMVGATVMPHVVYLHSAATRDRFGRDGDPARFDAAPSAAPIRQRLAATRLDVTLAMVAAGGVNVAMLLLAASALGGANAIDTIEGAHAAIAASLGGTVALLFALALLISGLASTAVGAYAGAAIMEGLLRRRVPLVARRLVTMLPAIGLLALGAEPTRTLVLSQVVLSFGIPFALVPLIWLTADRRVMGRHAVARSTTAAAAVVAVLISALNAGLIWLTLSGSA